jgi:hypothetical protein
MAKGDRFVDRLFTHPPLWIKIPAAALFIIVGIYPHVLPDALEPFARPVAFVLAAWLLAAIAWQLSNEWRIKREKPPLILAPEYRVALGALLAVGLLCFLIAPKRGIVLLTDRPDLVSMFVRDLPPKVGFQIHGCTDYERPDLKARIYYKIIGDVPVNSKILVFYIPTSNYTFHIIETIATEYNEWIIQIENTIHFNNFIQGNTSPVLSQNMVFSNAIYVYHQDTLDAVQIGNLTSTFNSKGLVLQLRGMNYVMGAWDAIKAGRIEKVPQYAINGCRILPTK